MENCGRFVFYKQIFIFSFLRSFSENVTSFLWSIVSQTIALDQSAREDSLSYCKIAVFHVLSSYFCPSQFGGGYTVSMNFDKFRDISARILEC